MEMYKYHLIIVGGEGQVESRHSDYLTIVEDDFEAAEDNCEYRAIFRYNDIKEKWEKVR